MRMTVSVLELSRFNCMFVSVHDCRMESVKDRTATTEWETWMLSHGLAATCRSVDDMHFKDTEERPGTSSKKT